MRRQYVHYLFAALTSLLIVPAAAFAQSQAFTNGPVNLRAGPAPDYPIVTQLAGGVPVTVMGCVAGYSWCDIALPNLRGWVYAGRLSYPYQGSNVPILSYGPTIGLPIVTFSIGTYWGNYYRGRPWYRDQSRWAHRPPPRPGHGGHGRPPGARPPGHGGQPPGHGGRPPGHGNGRPPGGPSHGAGGRPSGGSGGGTSRPPGNGGGARPGGGGHGGSHGGGQGGGQGGGSGGGQGGGSGGRPPRN